MNSENVQIHLPILNEKRVELYVKREDLIHPYISGNKFRKLYYNLQKAKECAARYLVTFGGAFSNHILATAVAGKEQGFKTIGVIRGEELGVNLKKTLAENHTLKKAHGFGMEFRFVSRVQYKQKQEPTFLMELKEQFPNSYIIPEGGTNELAIKGCEEILTETDLLKFTHIACAMGTGGTVSGIINRSKKEQRIKIFPALKGKWMTEEIKNFKVNKENWCVVPHYHFGGYAKVSDELVTFINTFYQQTGIPLDPIYTGKMMFGLLDMIEKGVLKTESKVLAIHTGGLQGIAGINAILKQKNRPLLL